MKNTNRSIVSVLSCLALTIAACSVSVSVFAAPVPVAGDAPVPVDRLRPGNPAVFPMTGTWRFKLEHGTSPAVKGELPADTAVPDFAAPEAADADWKNILVPANWEIEGFSIPTYQERTGNQSDDIGLYRRWVDVPASFAGQRVLWHFDGAYNGADVFVNGQGCGYHESGFTAFDIEVTKALKPGQRNLMAVRLYKRTSSASLDHGDFWCLGGIYRETYLVALPPLHVDDVTVVTDLDAHYKDTTLKSTVRVAGPAGAHFVLTGELYSLDGAKVALPAMSQAADLGTDAIVGATIWEWQAQGMYDKFPERWSVPSPGARNDPKTGYRTSGGNGPVTADRQITPLYWNLKMAHSPVNTTAREVAPAAGQCVVPLQNRYSFTDLAELTCRWQALAGEKVLSSGESHIAAKARSSVDASFPAPAGMDTLRLEFIHPDGRSVYVTRLHSKDYQGPAAPAALAAAGPVRLSETDQNVVVQTAGTQLVLDKRTAQITSWRAGDQDVMLGGPILNIGESIPGGFRLRVATNKR